MDNTEQNENIVTILGKQILKVYDMGKFVEHNILKSGTQGKTELAYIIKLINNKGFFPPEKPIK